MSGQLIPSVGSGDFFYFLYVFVIPGAVIWYFRSMYIVGRQEKLSENIAIFVLFSALYAMIFGVALQNLLKVSDDRLFRYFVWAGYVAVIPIVLGIFLGIGGRQKWFVGFLTSVGIKPKVSDPTGWDWIFSRLNVPVYLLVTLEDGSTVAGYFGLDSLASSDPTERDLYIEEIYDVDERGQWKPRKEKQAILIIGVRIRHIEMWKAPTTGAENG